MRELEELRIPTDLPKGEAFNELRIEQNLGEIAGLRPLPMGRMFRQAGRPMRQPRRPGDSQQTLNRVQNVQNTIENWNPLQAEGQQRLNNTNPTPRSKPAETPRKAAEETLRNLFIGAEKRAHRSFGDSRSKSDYELGPEAWKKSQASEDSLRKNADLSEFFTPAEREVAKQSLFSLFRKKQGKVSMEDVPLHVRHQMGRFSEETVHAYNKMLTTSTLDALEISRDLIRPIGYPGNPNPRGAGIGGI